MYPAMSAATQPLPDIDLQARCEACSALCCVTHPFDAQQGFGYDKPAHTPCQHLREDFACSIHAQLPERGFTGCVLYTCYGAGQRVTALYRESNWRAAPAEATTIYTVFGQMKTLHELQFLLSMAQQKVNAIEWQQRLAGQQQHIESLCRDLEKHRCELDTMTIREQTFTLLRQLATQPAIVALRNTHPARG